MKLFLVSEFYDEADYIFNYKEFVKFRKTVEGNE